MVRAQLNISIINKETKPLDLATPTVWKQTKDADTMVLGLLSPNMAHPKVLVISHKPPGCRGILENTHTQTAFSLDCEW